MELLQMVNAVFCKRVREKSALFDLSAEELVVILARFLPLQSCLQFILNFAVTEAGKDEQLQREHPEQCCLRRPMLAILKPKLVIFH